MARTWPTCSFGTAADALAAALLRALAGFELDLGGMQVQYLAGEHTGSRFVDLAMVGGDGRFIQSSSIDFP